MADVEELYHYGVLRRSGRYPWGSGGTPEEDHRSFLGYVKGLEKQGLSQVEIVKGLGLESTTQLRALRSIARNEVSKADAALALRLKEKGLSNVAIGQRMQIGESSVRALLSPALAQKRDILVATANMLKERVGPENYLDIGSGTESHLGISSTKLSAAVAVLKEQGYEVRNVQVQQLGTSNKTTVKVLAPPGTSYVDIVKNPSRIGTVAAYSEDGGRSFKPIIKTPTNVSSKRIAVVYAEQGGTKADGVIYIRPGKPDLSLGSARYAQVRIAVDGTHYLKGMAMYKDGLPKGVDLEFHTSKSDTGNKLDAMKKQSDEVNPFGATIRQRDYIDPVTGKSKLSPMNIVNAEGDWSKWSKTLSSQFLSKQSVGLAKRQLDLALQSRKEELDEIGRLTNPVVRKKLLQTFADNADSAAVQLKAAALPRQGTHVILPFPGMKENEVYAPTYRNGEKVVLVRHPHGGTFELPELTVNNKYGPAIAALGRPVDAIGIHPKVAERLSGADFDGDHVLVIPNNRREIKTSAPLSGLKNFDPKQAYPAYEGMTPMSARAKQQQMGDISNLITDMTIRGAKSDELARAVRHSMVVIDAEKHNLNYRQSAIDNGIASLKEKYQGRGATGRLSGASTIVSRAGSELNVAQRRPRSAAKGGAVDARTGARVYEETGASYVNKAGKTVVLRTKTTKLAEAQDARKLSSGMPIEEVYAAHSNSLKSLANQARKAALTTGGLHVSPSAKKMYESEVAKLNADLNLALKNSPLERQAQLLANTVVEARRAANPAMNNADLKKIKSQALETARARLGAQKHLIEITPEQWKAIQAGAVSTHKLSLILDNADLAAVRKLATPRAATVMTPAKLALAEARLASGYTQAEIADSLGVPVSTLNSALLAKGG